ncbi:hypothetical protein ACWE42_15035 [Sutcliffiella cohnii]
MKKSIQSIQNKFKVVSSVYFLLMLIVYSGYVFLFNFRMSKSEDWMSKSILTQENVETIAQFGSWSERIEILFIISFVLASVFFIFQKQLLHFAKVNLLLTVSIFILSVVFYFVTSLTIFQLLLPLMNLAIFAVILVIYLLIKGMVKKFSKDNIVRSV